MANRPYFNDSFYSLRKLAEENRDNLDICKQILHELSFRSTDYAVDLREELQVIIESHENPKLPFLFKLLKKRDLLARDKIDKKFLKMDFLLNGRVVGITGNQPQKEEEIRSLAFWNGAILGDYDIWQDNQVIVVGRRDFDKDYLKQAVELIITKTVFIYFISQEVFLDFLETGEMNYHYPGDPRIDNHPGLIYLSSIGFKWPSIGKYKGITKLENFEGEDHDLAVKYGYSVRAGVSPNSRRRSLNLGVSALGLQVVAYHIAGLINRNQNNPNMKYAVPRWREDLDWLHKTKYLNHLHSFIWPSSF